eukprot:Hpha_TRINITY_DN11783_c1_g1::TRINITY_DN11783_c1_g1_i1::g.31892::m.31892
MLPAGKGMEEGIRRCEIGCLALEARINALELMYASDSSAEGGEEEELQRRSPVSSCGSAGYRAGEEAGAAADYAPLGIQPDLYSVKAEFGGGRLRGASTSSSGRGSLLLGIREEVERARSAVETVTLRLVKTDPSGLKRGESAAGRPLSSQSDFESPCACE